MEPKPPQSAKKLSYIPLILGMLLGALNVVSLIYLGLLTGFGYPLSFIGVIVCYVLMSRLRRAKSGKPSEQEMTLSLTLIDSCGNASLVFMFMIPALIILGAQFSLAEAVLVAVMSALIGIFAIIPFREGMLINEKVPFPGSIALSQLIRTLTERGEIRIKYFLYPWAISLIWVMMTEISLTFLGFSLYSLDFSSYIPPFTIAVSLSPIMFGLGFLIGKKSPTLMLIGAIVLYWIIIPVQVLTGGLSAGYSFSQITEFSRWIALGLIISSALTSLLKSPKVLFRGMKMPARMPLHVAVMGWITPTVVLLVLFWSRVGFGSILAVVLSTALLYAITRTAGEIGIGPVSAAGWIILFVSALFTHDLVVLGLFSAVAMVSAGSAVMTMSDLKVGLETNTSFHNQIYSTLIGTLMGFFIAIPFFFALDKIYGIGTSALPSPIALVWSRTLSSIAEGNVAVNPLYIIFPFAVGILTTFFGFSGTALGVAFILPFESSFSIFLGALAAVLLERRLGKNFIKEAGLLIASGMIAGESIAVLLSLIIRLFIQV
jgi:uncharacterized oligopeptide transporter (OPT) family protein